MKKSIFLKIFGLYLLVIILLSSSILFFTFKSIKSHHLDYQKQSLINITSALELKILPLVEQKQFKELEILIKNLDKIISTRITVIDSRGVVLADSENDPKSMENHKYRAEILKALNGEIGQSIRTSPTNKEEMLYVAKPLREKGRIIAVLRVSVFLKQINQLLDSLKNRIFHIVIIILTVSFILSYFFSRSLSKPIKLLAGASRDVAGGNFASRVYLKNRGEFKVLADSFNYMSSEIQASFEKISRQKEELNSIIFSMQEGLVLLDKDDKIILFNRAFAGLAGAENPGDKFIWEIIRDPKLSALVKKVRMEKKNALDEIELDQKTLLLSATGIPGSRRADNELVLILHDITELKKLETIKKDFVENVSHELKTPLTAVKGFIETMEEEKELNKRYLDVIKRNIDRLISIVQDLSVLSNLENKGARTDFREVYIKEAVENAVKIFEKQINEKGLFLKLELDKNLPGITADPFKLEQLFINLLDNAVKYTEKGGVTISAEKSGSHIKIEVIDTGIGIPKEHLSRIFERFYVVDKSRSRKLGGTGLGLSIVKHIVLLHNGSITAENLPAGEHGTKFIINLPI
ncbi:MAG: hypothetical protein A2297_01055 [Elusimicrobia bacterium RIFOXYB2_FULL_48_7]|nr:MAG: hypothetical protein A2297_01055 [Elusimicrobia bacterium RIFOXYB2_FULL_48_7]